MTIVMADSTAAAAVGAADDLVERFRQGEEAAFDQIVAQYQPRVIRLAQRLLAWPDDVNDVAQEVFLAVYRNLAEIPAEHLSRVSMYVPPGVGSGILGEIVAKGCDEFWLNPGSESDDLVERARQMGLDPIIACSVVNIGMDPHEMDG